MALRELRVRALRAPVGPLNGPEELRLEPVRVVLVELLVRRAERRERDGDPLDGLGKFVEQSIASFAVVLVLYALAVPVLIERFAPRSAGGSRLPG
jgi:hypothetical protein